MLFYTQFESSDLELKYSGSSVLQQRDLASRIVEVEGKKKMSKMIPHSVTMRRLGFVFNPRAKFMTSPWVDAVEKLEQRLEARRNFSRRVNKTVDVLTRFVATWVAQSRAARSTERVRAAGEKWRLAALSPNWANIMEIEDARVEIERAEEEARRQATRDAYEARLLAMSDSELIEYHQRTMAEHRIHHEDYRPWMEFISKIHAKRAANRVALVDNAQMWVELNAAPRLHNTQRSAQIRRVISRNAFSALDSDSE